MIYFFSNTIAVVMLGIEVFFTLLAGCFQVFLGLLCAMAIIAALLGN